MFDGELGIKVIVIVSKDLLLDMNIDNVALAEGLGPFGLRKVSPTRFAMTMAYIPLLIEFQYGEMSMIPFDFLL